VANIAIALNT
jgi:hypothetical protein